MRRTIPVALLALAGLACGGSESEAPPLESPPRPPLAYAIHETLPRELLREANGGRDVLGEDGYFAIPPRVTRVWVDVGAHHLETTREMYKRSPDLALIAIEPLAECWPTWPKGRRLIGIPAAIHTERGRMEFHVNAADVTSSLAPSLTESSVADLTRTVEVREVPVLRLEDVLERIPPEISIDYIKTDVQGVDLQVLESAGEHLRRARRVRAEVINEAIYGDVGEDKTGTEREFVAFMKGMGFRFIGDVDIAPGRNWLDKDFVNEALPPGS